MTTPDLKLYNSLTREKEVFTPLDPDNVRMYACGPTVYNFIHLGNARPIVTFDVLFRLLLELYPNVTYARNMTDVDDKIIAAAKAESVSEEQISQRFALELIQDTENLNTLPPTHHPLATSYIPQMITMIEQLIENGHAYAADGHVLFNVPSYTAYGKLSRRDREGQIDGARIEVAPYKQDPADFVLWKPSPEGMIGWDSPWGKGRPGWHIECSAMATDLLGPTFDIHCGGGDLMFPHHENEIAQSCCAHKDSHFAKIWMHNGMLNVDGKKMSKSLGNFFTVRELLDEYRGETLRFALLGAHYRQPLDFSRERLAQTENKLRKWYDALQEAIEAHGMPNKLIPCPDVMAALCDDLNTPRAIAALHMRFRALKKGNKDALAQILYSANLLGILQDNPQSWLIDEEMAAENCTLTPDEIEAQIKARWAARTAKDYGEADRIRDVLLKAGIVLEDTAKGTDWSFS